MSYHHSMETLTVDNYHIDLLKEVFDRNGLEFNPDYLSEPVVHFNGPQVVVYHSYVSGPGEIDHISIVAFYVPHDGQCTVVVNHLNGILHVDNADLMFPPKEPKK